MLNRIKITSGLSIIVIIFSGLLATSCFVFFSALNNNNNNFVTLYKMVDRAKAQESVWLELMKTRLMMYRGIILLQEYNYNFDHEEVIKSVEVARQSLKNAKTHWELFESLPAAVNVALLSDLTSTYSTYISALDELMFCWEKKDIKGFIVQPTQKYQNEYEKQYDNYMAIHNKEYQTIERTNTEAFSRTLKVLAFVISALVIVIIAAWLGIKNILITPLNHLITNIQSIADGNLIKPNSVHGSNEMGKLANSLRHMQAELARIVGDVRNGSETIYSGLSEIANDNNNLSSRTEQQAASLEETAASMEELTATVRQNAENARLANDLALTASSTAQRGGKVVNNVVDTMKDIGTSSQRIADINSVIDSIAFQTNILALNAAVEAARAGEQGRGFAVVASEVRNLAQRSAHAAQEIKCLIEDSVQRVENGSRLVEHAGETMGEIVSAVTRVADIMKEISSASDEQSRGIDLVGRAVCEMDRVTQQNAALVEQSASAAVSLEEQAGRLNESVAVFHISQHISRET
ncbi:HAMP domain-containing protein [Citrobacter sp. wls619]|uniref:methyl-accepting chemotaxis protein n=1 Tax=Citrobacter sp. wls619 TaxID=2576432 RepID=UPI0010C968F7|nr:methyl-accepting chemotaxis protein [Citrobacter sp. wls619]TKV07887.1 HAMP domain-containing protein [Citrobacter sp. wls619]